MSASQQTTNYNLPKFAGADKPAWLVDFNGAMDQIDSSLKTVEDLSSGLSGQVTQNTNDIASLDTDIGNAESLIATNTSDIATLGSTKAPITNPNFVGTVYANGLNLLLLKNAIINGGFQVNQRRKSGTVILNAGQYGHDRWKAGASGCTYTFNTVENLTTITITAGSLIQIIEGLNLETDTYTLAWEGTAPGKIGAGAYGVSGITGAVVGGTNLNIEFGVGTVAKVRFNRGATPILWQIENYADVYNRCIDYYWDIYSLLGFMPLTAFGNAYNATDFYTIVQLPKKMRGTITSIEYENLSASDIVNAPTVVSALVIQQSTDQIVHLKCTTTSLVQFRPYQILSGVSGNGHIAFNAEL